MLPFHWPLAKFCWQPFANIVLDTLTSKLFNVPFVWKPPERTGGFKIDSGAFRNAFFQTQCSILHNSIGKPKRFCSRQNDFYFRFGVPEPPKSIPKLEKSTSKINKFLSMLLVFQVRVALFFSCCCTSVWRRRRQKWTMKKSWNSICF